MSDHGPLRVGIGGPVGSGKTALTDALCKRMRDDFSVAVITNDIYTRNSCCDPARCPPSASSASRRVAARIRRYARTHR